MRVKLEAALDFLNSLKGQAVEVGLGSLTVTCDALRAGQQTINLTVDPERAAALLDKAKSMPGVVAAGWTSWQRRDGSHHPLSRRRLARWRQDQQGQARDRHGQRPEQDASGQTVGGGLERQYRQAEAQLQAPEPVVYPSLGLTENIEITALASADKPGASDRLMLWVSSPVITTADESAGPKLNLSEESSSDEEGGEPRDDNGSLEALAREFRGQRWDSDKSAWK